MKVVLINGSVHEHGCTSRALEEMKIEFEKNGIEVISFCVGKDPIPDSLVNDKESPKGKQKIDEFMKLAEECDGFVFGGPVYFSNPSGQLMSFMNRVFYGSKPELFAGKVGVGITTARRAGVVSTMDDINHYFYLKQMIIPTAFYWNQVYGAVAKDVEEDKEGLQNLRRLAQNMTYILKLIELGKKNGIEFPSFDEKKERTNFIR